MAIESQRKSLNRQQTELRGMMASSGQHDEAIELFLHHHAMLHSAKMSRTDIWSFEDAILDDMDEEHMRRIPHNCEHSVAWTIWHIARIEDVAMNMLVVGALQVFQQGNWVERMNVSVRDTGNEMSTEEMARLSEEIDVEALRAYRMAVGRRTREIVVQLEPSDLKQKVDPDRLEQVMAEGALVEAARGIRDYWSRRDIAGLLLMPATRHNIVHLNEALRLKRRRR